VLLGLGDVGAGDVHAGTIFSVLLRHEHVEEFVAFLAGERPRDCFGPEPSLPGSDCRPRCRQRLNGAFGEHSTRILQQHVLRGSIVVVNGVPVNVDGFDPLHDSIDLLGVLQQV